MIRIAGRTLNPKKQIRFALSPIKGIGKNNVRKLLNEVHDLLAKAKLEEAKTKKDDFQNIVLETLSEEALVVLRNQIETQYLIEDDLRRKVTADIKRLVDLDTWRGSRHKAGLPTRGQTTRTNSRTRRGNQRLSKGSGKIKATKK